jgi:hypothetical protein
MNTSKRFSATFPLSIRIPISHFFILGLLDPMFSETRLLLSLVKYTQKLESIFLSQKRHSILKRIFHFFEPDSKKKIYDSSHFLDIRPSLEN